MLDVVLVVELDPGVATDALPEGLRCPDVLDEAPGVCDGFGFRDELETSEVRDPVPDLVTPEIVEMLSFARLPPVEGETDEGGF